MKIHIKKYLIILVVFCILSTVFLFTIPKTRVVLGIEIPGLHCGVAGGKNIGLADSSEECCSIKNPPKCLNLENPILDKALQVFAPIRNALNSYNKSCNLLKEMNDNYGKQECIAGEPITMNGKCICEMPNLTTNTNDLIKVCQRTLYKLGPQEMDKCVKCTQGITQDGRSTQIGLYTAIGCVPLEINTFIQRIFSLAIGFAGSFSFLCILFSAFRMLLSQGKPEAIKKASEMLRSCIFGLLLIIFAVFILRLVGIDILRIPFLK